MRVESEILFSVTLNVQKAANDIAQEVGRIVRENHEST